MDEIKKRVADNFAYYRRKNNYSQKQIGELIGANTTTVSGWEVYTSAINIEKLYKACKIFNISIDDMFLTKEERNNKSEQKEFTLSDNEQILIQKYRDSLEMQLTINRIFGIPIDSNPNNHDTSSAPAVEILDLISKFCCLDTHGKEVVNTVINLEFKNTAQKLSSNN